MYSCEGENSRSARRRQATVTFKLLSCTLTFGQAASKSCSLVTNSPLRLASARSTSVARPPRSISSRPQNNLRCRQYRRNGPKSTTSPDSAGTISAPLIPSSSLRDVDESPSGSGQEHLYDHSVDGLRTSQQPPRRADTTSGSRGASTDHRSVRDHALLVFSKIGPVYAASRMS